VVQHGGADWLPVTVRQASRAPVWRTRYEGDVKKTHGLVCRSSNVNENKALSRSHGSTRALVGMNARLDGRTVGWRDVAAWTMVEDVEIAALQASTIIGSGEPSEGKKAER
jgi:hypothetical protein